MSINLLNLDDQRNYYSTSNDHILMEDLNCHFGEVVVDFDVFPDDYNRVPKFGYCSPGDDADDSHMVPIKFENSIVSSSGDGSSSATSTSTNYNLEERKKNKNEDIGFRVAFRTKSAIEIMDDGFKWRKYGKKKVKNSPHPRNYYRCASRGCFVKKRVERDSTDASFVITTYDGTHNHQSPCVLYYNQTPLLVPTGWTLQASHDPS